ncbi:uncharacterized protein LOC111467267 [Cucurbita maxima]|uniref:Uncharacterized protein LOC111467267 n=1 Tax=Cucurbita maxima TaxID=3661 RepID=A0A6J1HS22_CUCMA|nr:uncharacterized protein LOC111467267 [Cucurbita maxima]XP_022967893.1 uncharacterized protein LOC111467267 [Cucurbita maxima]
MANPRRTSISLLSSSNPQSLETPFHIQSHGRTLSLSLRFLFSFLKNFLKKPHAFPFLLSVFLLLTWISLRIQHSSSQFSSPDSSRFEQNPDSWSKDGDLKANLVRFKSGFPSPISRDKRGWLLDPISLALDSGIPGGAVSCASVHIGEIQPGAMRGNHRHHTCNETFVLWGATTKFRLENSKVGDKGYAEVIISADEVAVAASPRGTAHALINMDPVRTTLFLGCQDGIINYNSSTSDFKVWKDL